MSVSLAAYWLLLSVGECSVPSSSKTPSSAVLLLADMIGMLTGIIPTEKSVGADFIATREVCIRKFPD
jgi:hypothetical protein